MVRRLGIITVLALILLAGAHPIAAQTSGEVQELRKSIQELRDSQQRMEKDLGEIKALLRGARAGAAPEDDPKSVDLSIAGERFKGQASARLVLVDFTDYQ
jgi:hypothetical protein